MLSAFDCMNYFSRFSYESRMHSRIIYHAIQYIAVLLDLTVIYFGLFQIQQDARSNLATNVPYESMWTFDVIVQFWIMFVQNNPRYNLSLVDNVEIGCWFWLIDSHLSRSCFLFCRNFIQILSKVIFLLINIGSLPGSRPTLW